MWQREEEISEMLSNPPFNFNYLLRALSRNIVTLGVRASTPGFWGDTIHFMQMEEEFIWPKNVTRAEYVRLPCKDIHQRAKPIQNRNRVVDLEIKRMVIQGEMWGEVTN